MGSYNPHAPRILGQEWVPIREENLPFSPSVNAFELGTSFRLDTARQVRDARFYTNKLQAPRNQFQTAMVNIYPAGLEDLTGPIKQLIIPVNSGTVTGVGITLLNSANVAEAVAQPSDNKGITIPMNPSGAQRMGFWFNVSSASPELANKRILNVSLLYAGYLTDGTGGISIPFVTTDPSLFPTIVEQRNDLGTDIDFVGPAYISNTGALAQLATIPGAASNQPFANQVIGVLNLGDINNFWDPALSPISTTDFSRMPWRYVDLLRFEPSFPNVNRQMIRVTFQIPLAMANARGFLDYIALRVIYCEETRIAYGGKRFAPYEYGTNIITMRDTLFQPNPILAAGNYTATLSWVNPGEVDYDDSLKTGIPQVNGLRELYQIPSHPGIEIDIPFPSAERLGETFTKVETHVLPQLTLHATGGAPLTEPHVYGRQAIAQVYGSKTATQEIHDGLAGGSASWPWVRYIARRFGDTTIPLTFTIAGQSVAITPAEFDSLNEILDGWKEITLRFVTAPTMGAGTQPQGVWSATGELAGNRWEVLGASAPAISGTPGNLLNLVPLTQRLDIATYGQPVSGASINLGWIVQGVGSPWVSGTVDDTTSDAFVIFAQDAPSVSGFSITTLSQAITGIGQECGIDPCCIPTDILYNQLHWTALADNGGLSLPGTSGNWASTPDNAALDIVGDIDLRADVTMTDWTPTGDATLVSKWFIAQASYALNIAPTGLLTMLWSTDGTATTLRSSTVAPVVANGGRLAVRATLDVDNGAAGHTVTFYTAPTINGPWTQLGDPVITAGVTSIFSGTASGEVGGIAGTTNLWAGTAHAAQIRSGINGTIVANPNFTAQLPGTTSFTDSAGRVWTVNGTASIVSGTSNVAYSAFELQRMDTVEPGWQTIMLASNMGVTGFADYEARVGILSSYRIRVVDVYDFPGPWSSTITATISSPGVSGGCLSGGHVLIFTSNEHQNGSINLAYSTAWMGESVEEDFVFPEAGFVQLQLMYNKDFVTAFRPLERGGERFNRTLLVQAAAIAPETLADFRSLRDMAWDTVNYICVRDEDGNRWFATVLVPGGRVLRDRRLYLAPVEIIETNDTPTPVDP